MELLHQKEVVSQKTFPFDVQIVGNSVSIGHTVDSLYKQYVEDSISIDEFSDIMRTLDNAGHIVLTRKEFSKPFNNTSKTKWDLKNQRNPLTGKGKSYGKHVEDGWGKHIPLIRRDPDLDEFYFNGLWR